MACANAAFLATLRDDVLTPRVVQRVVGRAPEVATAVADDPRLGARLNDWQGLLERQPIQARQLLRKLLVGPLRYTPRRDEAGGYYDTSPTRPRSGDCPARPPLVNF